MSSTQHLYFLYEVYDPSHGDGSRGEGSRGIRVLTSIAFFRGRVRVFETPVLETTAIGDTGRNAAVIQLDVPASALQAGLYTCQVNIIDDMAGTFAFPRLQFALRP